MRCRNEEAVAAYNKARVERDETIRRSLHSSKVGKSHTEIHDEAWSKFWRDTREYRGAANCRCDKCVQRDVFRVLEQ